MEKSSPDLTFTWQWATAAAADSLSHCHINTQSRITRGWARRWCDFFPAAFKSLRKLSLEHTVWCLTHFGGKIFLFIKHRNVCGWNGRGRKGIKKVQWCRRRATVIQMHLHEQADKGLSVPGSPRSTLLPMGRGCRECEVQCRRSSCFPFHCTEKKEIESRGFSGSPSYPQLAEKGAAKS